VIELEVADLVLIAGRVLGWETTAVLERLDIEAAEAAFADVRPLMSGGHPARPAAALLRALVHRRPLPESNERVALMVMVQFLAVNGVEVDLDPGEQTRTTIAEVSAGRLDAAGLADWLAPRLRPRIVASAECGNQASPLRWLRARRRRRPGDPFHRFTDTARAVVVLAQDEARRLSHNYIGTEHILLGLAGEGEGVAAKALQLRGISLEAVRDQVEEIIGRGERTPVGPIPFTPRAKRVLLEYSLREAMQLRCSYVGTEHLLLGLLREGNGVAADVLVNLGAYHATTREQVIDLLHGYLHDHPGEPQTPLPELRDLDDQITQTRLDEEAAIGADDAEAARSLRATEKRLLSERRQRVGEWMAGADLVALVEETHRLRAEVEHLRAQLRERGFEPGDGPPSAAHGGR